MSEHAPEEAFASSLDRIDDGGTLVRIVGDGTRRGTRVELVRPDGSTEPLRNVQRIEYAIAVDQQPIRARITVARMAVNMTVKADIVEEHVRAEEADA